MYNRRMKKRLVTGAFVALFYIALWQIASMAVGKSLILPSPLAVLAQLRSMVVTAPFWRAVGLSLSRVATGYLAGVLLGVALAAPCHALGLARALVRPLMGVIRATPVASFIILAIYFMSGSAGMPGLISFLMVLPVMFGNVLEGLDNASPAYLEMARVFRARKLNVALKIYLPAALPYAMAAALTSLGLAWKAGIAAEVLGNPELSIGRALRDSRTYLETPSLFAWTLVVILLSLALEALLRLALQRAGARMSQAGITHTRTGPEK